MSKIVKLIWTLISYAPLYLVIGAVLLVDSLTDKELVSSIFWGIGFILGAILSLPICFAVIKLARKHLEPSKLRIITANSRDNDVSASLIAYMVPMITLAIGDVNLWVFITVVLIVVVFLLWSKAVFINPLVYFFHYKYYNVQAVSGMGYTLLSKRKRFDPKAEFNVIEIFSEIYMEV